MLEVGAQVVGVIGERNPVTSCHFESGTAPFSVIWLYQ